MDQHAATPFEYGRHDCALFVAGAVLAMTGHDFGAPFRGRYRSAAGAVRALRLHGAGDLPSTMTAALGDPVHPAFAGRGDVVSDGDNVGISMGGFALFVSDAGMTRRPMPAMATAWVVRHG